MLIDVKKVVDGYGTRCRKSTDCLADSDGERLVLGIGQDSEVDRNMEQFIRNRERHLSVERYDRFAVGFRKDASCGGRALARRLVSRFGRWRPARGTLELSFRWLAIAVGLVITASLSACDNSPEDDGAIIGGTPDPGGTEPPATEPPANQAPTAVFSSNPTGGLAALNVELDASASSDVDGTIVEYQWSLGDGNTASGPMVSHVYSVPGTYTVDLTITDDDGATSSAQNEIRVLANLDNSLAIVPDSILFFDDFEYVVSRDQGGARATFMEQGGWDSSKTHQDGESAAGYLYTAENIPGYSGPFPGRGSNSVLAIEARPGSLGSQTDFYLELSSPSLERIPGNVWFQFWAYPQYFGDQLSRWRPEDKFFYVCNSSYPCHSHKWMLLWGAGAYNPSMQDGINGSLPFGDPSRGEFLWHLRDAAGVSEIQYFPAAQGDQEKLGQTDLSEHMARNRWTLVKIHFDTSSSSGTWEMWLKPLGSGWVKVAEWIDGVTPDFNWSIPAQEIGGHRALRMPTTVGGTTDEWYDSWLYVDDFAMAVSEDTLPLYPY